MSMKDAHVSYLWGKKVREDEERREERRAQDRFETVAYWIICPPLLLSITWQAVSLLFE
jgi:hypothetical protein